MKIYAIVQSLIVKAIECNLIKLDDEIYARNQIISLLKLDSFQLEEELINEQIPDLLDKIEVYACEEGIINDLTDERDILINKIMNCFMDKPSIVNDKFFQAYGKDPKEATDYFYKLSRDNNYIQTKRIAKNIQYKVLTEYGELDITINLSKPEKNPKDIAAQKNIKSLNYPKCLLCNENEGYVGRIGHPARANHRIIPMTLENEKWFMQYSPYVYYNEHCIVLSEEHRDMKIHRDSFTKLLEFVEKFPHYFLGSNADLPIVGGSILSHDHYQGGNYEFAMTKAENEYSFKLEKFKNTGFAIIKWPMSVLRLRSMDKRELAEAADYVLNKWRNYSDESVNVIAYSNEIPHNTVTPIGRIKNDIFEIDLVLRNNRTTKQYPSGIFHPHEDVHHIKKENIGLIEVMGLAVLPARLKTEIIEIEKYLLNQDNQIEDYHKPWAKELKFMYLDRVNRDNINLIIRKEVGMKFLRVLEDSGVFKRDEDGRGAFRRFISTL